MRLSARERRDLETIRRAFSLASDAAAVRAALRLAASSLLYPNRPRELLADVEAWAATADWSAPPCDATRLADLRRRIRACLGRPVGPCVRRRT